MIRRVASAGAVAALALPSGASALDRCADATGSRIVLSGKGTLESILPDGERGMLYTDVTAGALMRLDKPGGTPVRVAAVPDPGGLVRLADGTLLVGTGNGIAGGATGPVLPRAQLLRVDLATGATSVYASGLQMANGLARGEDDTVYASNDITVASGIDRVLPGGGVQTQWAPVPSANGLAVDSTGRYLFAAQTFVPAAIARVDLATRAVTTYARPAEPDLAAGLDGMTIDERDRLFVAANLFGQVWRADPGGALCKLADQPGNASAVAFGGGGSFPAQNLYAVGFNGTMAEIPDARPAPAPASTPAAAKQRLTVTPKRVRAGSLVRFRITLKPAVRRRVRIGSRVVRLSTSGRATVRVRFRTPGRRTVSLLTKRKGAPKATITVLPKR